MQAILSEIESALAVVQKTLDALTSRGDHELAFDIARAQYRASIRSSWPQNLAPLVSALKETHKSKDCKLNDDERAELQSAIATFQRIITQ